MRKLAITLIALFLLAVAWPLHAAGTARLHLSPKHVGTKSGELVTITVLLETVYEQVDTVRVSVAFPPTLLEVVRFDLGALFLSASPGNTIDNRSGRLSYGGFRTEAPLTVAGTVGTIVFRALRSGTATVALQRDSRVIGNGEERGDSAHVEEIIMTITGPGVASLHESPPPSSVRAEASPSLPRSTNRVTLNIFRALTARAPSNDEDWRAVRMMTDGHRPAKRNLTRERLAIGRFRKVFRRLPSSTKDWNVIAAIAYTTAVAPDSNVSSPSPTSSLSTTSRTASQLPIVEQPTEGSPPAIEALPLPSLPRSTNRVTLNIFRALTARAPSNDEDWRAVRMMTDGHRPAKRNLTRERLAIGRFRKAFRRLPSSTKDWNVIAAIAYTTAVAP